MPAASGWTTSKLSSSLWIFRVISRRCLRFILCQLFGVGRPLAFLFLSTCLSFNANLPTVNSIRLGPVGDPYTVSPLGSGRGSLPEQRRHHLYNRQYRSHTPLSGRNAPETFMRP